MKILVVGKKQLMHWPETTARFLSQKNQIKLFLYNKWTFSSIFYKFFFRNQRYKKCAQRLRQQILSFQPNLIIYVSSFFIPLECYQILDEFPNIPRIGWVGDAFETKEKERANYLNILFCTDTGYLKNAKTFKCQSFYLPLCVDETVFVNRHLSKTIPPFFVGIANEIRISYLKAIKNTCLIYGRGWPHMSQHEIHNHRISYKKAQNFINRSIAPININLSKNNVNGLNFRVFEIPSCGGLILMNDMPDLHLCYQVGKEAIVYKTPEELNKLIEDIIKQPKKYEKIALAGYERTMREHTYTKRLEQMFEILRTQKIIDF